MAFTSDIFEGLKIITKYSDPDDMGEFMAEHDQIWCGDASISYDIDDVKTLTEELGWFIDEDSWSHFT